MDVLLLLMLAFCEDANCQAGMALGAVPEVASWASLEEGFGSGAEPRMSLAEGTEDGGGMLRLEYEDSRGTELPDVERLFVSRFGGGGIGVEEGEGASYEKD